MTLVGKRVKDCNSVFSTYQPHHVKLVFSISDKTQRIQLVYVAYSAELRKSAIIYAGIDMTRAPDKSA